MLLLLLGIPSHQFKKWTNNDTRDNDLEFIVDSISLPSVVCTVMSACFEESAQIFAFSAAYISVEGFM